MTDGDYSFMLRNAGRSLPALLVNALLLFSTTCASLQDEVVVAEVNVDANTLLAENNGVVSSVEVPMDISGMDAMTNSFPSFRNGGLVFFLHIPKTGGTTIRKNLEGLDRVDYVFCRNYSVYWNETPKVENAILHGTANSTILFYEIHANDAPSFYRMRKRLERWRETANHNSIPIFFFSVVRDPLAFAFSHFSFFHLQYRNPTFEQCNATEENFLRFSLWNPQCQFLFKGEKSLRAQRAKQIVVQPDECNEVQQHMWRLLDWVGTTERLSNETLPLLGHLLDLPKDFIFERFKVSNKTGATFGVENVTAATLKRIQEMSALDTELYQTTSQLFRFPSTPLEISRGQEYSWVLSKPRLNYKTK